MTQRVRRCEEALKSVSEDRLEILADLAVVNEISPLGDRIYDVREREGLGWEGPKVTAYSKAVQRLLGRLPK